VRKSKAPLKTFDNLPNSYAQTTVSFSPDERLIMTGTSTEKEGNKGGLLVFFDRQRLEFVRRVGVSANQSVVYSLWHPKLNQVGSLLMVAMSVSRLSFHYSSARHGLFLLTLLRHFWFATRIVESCLFSTRVSSLHIMTLLQFS